MTYIKKLLEEAKEEEREELSPEKLFAEKEEKEEEESPVDKEIKEKKKTLVAEYGEVKIYRVEGEPLLIYTVPVPRPKGPERKIISILKEAATRIITISPYRIRDPEARRNVYKQKVLEIIDASPELGIPKTKREFYAEAVVREMVGYGILDPLVRDDNLEDILVLGPGKPVYVFHREYEMMKTNVVFLDDKEIRDIIDKIAREVGRRVDINNPLLDARLPDGSRVAATIPPASVDGSTISIRKFRKTPFSVVELIELGTFSPELAAFLWLAVDGMFAKPANMLIAGGTGSGKTTTLNVLSAFIPPTERVISIEDTAELKLPLEHWVRLEARPPSIEGTGEIPMDVLMKYTLRMRPDRIIVGEVRHAEAYTLFTAMNTGHDGSMGTIHANSARETLVRVTSPPMNVPEVMLSALNFILVQNKIYDRRKGLLRRVTEIAEVTGVLEGKPQVQTVWTWDAAEDRVERTSVPVNYLRVLSRFTALNVSDIEMEIQERAEFLEDLRMKGVKDMVGIKEKTDEFVMGRRERWRKM